MLRIIVFVLDRGSSQVTQEGESGWWNRLSARLWSPFCQNTIRFTFKKHTVIY